MILFRLEADVDSGVPSRILDLLVVQDLLPEVFTFHCDGLRMTLSLAFAQLAPKRAALMIARMRQIPGVQSAAPFESAAR
jgi:hypothetical protein